jgi:AraC family transcriptional regulator
VPAYYLPSSRFAQLSEITSGASVYPHEVRYLAGLSDGLIQEVSWTLLEELRAPTSGGRVLVETLALSLTARLAQAYSAGHSGFANPLQSRCQIDDVRLNRVLEYMAQHIEDEISLDDLAAVACLSPFHFIRMFRNRMGDPPHRYLSKMRLERAKTLLSHGEESIGQIALACCFATQSNFTRAFHRATGMSPGAYRRRRSSR